jgi:hypothetical protein
MDRKIKIGDHEVDIRMKLSVMDHINTIAGIDAFTFLSTASTNVVYATAVLLYAGICSYADKYGTATPEFDTVKRIVSNDGDVTLFQELAAIYGKFLNPGEAPQVKETANPSPGRIVKNSPSEASV